MTAEYPYAKDGAVVDQEDGTEVEYEDFDQLARHAMATLAAIEEAKLQRIEIELRCADGHDWFDPSNNWYRDNPQTRYRCKRRGCQGEKAEPGWLPFEPKPHPWNIFNQGQCTGPGCYSCGVDEMNQMIADLPPPSITRGGIRFPTSDQMESVFREGQ